MINKLFHHTHFKLEIDVKIFFKNVLKRIWFNTYKKILINNF